MHTITMVRIGLPSTGRITTRSIRTPPMKDTTSVPKNATQYGSPAFIIVHARYVENIAISPCA